MVETTADIANMEDALLSKIEALPGVETLEPLVDRISIQINETELSVEDLHERIHQLGGRIYMFQPEAMDMETAFMKLTEGKTQ